jgi:hypothetical protein
MQRLMGAAARRKASRPHERGRAARSAQQRRPTATDGG